MNIVHHLITTANETLSSYGPTTLFLNPSAITVSDDLIYKIVYNWGDTSDTVMRKLNTSSIDSSDYPHSSDPGDPRNTIVSHDFLPSLSSITTYTIEVEVHYTGDNTSTTYETITLNIHAAPLVEFGSNGGYAQAIHLVANRIWGADKKLFIVETVDPHNVHILSVS